MKFLVLLSLVFISCKNIQNKDEKDTHIRKISSTQDQLTSDSSSYGEDDGISFNQIYDTPASDLEGGEQNQNNSSNASDTDIDIYCKTDLEDYSEDLHLLPHNKIALCHFPPGNPDNYRVIIVSVNALHTHFEHGHDHHGEARDYLLGNNLSQDILKQIKSDTISCRELCKGDDNSHNEDESINNM